jgi:spermidine/putrescine transport system substrate-binding protein
MKSLSLIALIAATPALADEIRVLNWQGYGTDAAWAVEAFTAATGHTVVHDYFNSEQEMLTKLRTNPGAYDVVLINSAFTAQAQAEGLIAPIDPAMIPNLGGVDPALLSNPDLNPAGSLHGVPWTWGLTSLAYNSDELGQPTSLAVLSDPAFAGRVSLRDDALEAVQIAALATRQNINAITDLDAIRAKLTEILPNITTFWSSENDWNQYFAAGDFVVASYWSGSALRSRGMGLPVGYTVPVEGAIGWLDGLSVPTSSTRAEAAHAFINWMIDPAFYVQWEAEGAPFSASETAMAALAADSQTGQFAATLNAEVMATIQFMQPVPDDVRETYLALWQELKAAQ